MICSTVDTNHVVRPMGEVEWKLRWVCSDEEVKDEVETQIEDEEFGNRTVKKVLDPKEPTKEEREEHEKTHLPFRNWCRHCVRGRGVQMFHKLGSQETCMNEIHMDYGFLGKEDDSLKKMPMTVVKERTSKMLMGAVVPTKTTGSYVQKRITGFLKEIGCLHGDLVVKSDQEPAIDVVVESVAKSKAADGSGR